MKSASAGVRHRHSDNSGDLGGQERGSRAAASAGATCTSMSARRTRPPGKEPIGRPSKCSPGRGPSPCARAPPACSNHKPGRGQVRTRGNPHARRHQRHRPASAHHPAPACHGASDISVSEPWSSGRATSAHGEHRGSVTGAGHHEDPRRPAAPSITSTWSVVTDPVPGAPPGWMRARGSHDPLSSATASVAVVSRWRCPWRCSWQACSSPRRPAARAARTTVANSQAHSRNRPPPATPVRQDESVSRSARTGPERQAELPRRLIPRPGHGASRSPRACAPPPRATWPPRKPLTSERSSARPSPWSPLVRPLGGVPELTQLWNGEVLSMPGSLGIPSTRSARMLFASSSVPPRMRRAGGGERQIRPGVRAPLCRCPR